MTSKELSEKTGLKQSRISQLTKGFRQGNRFIPAYFIEGYDFIRDQVTKNGTITYTDHCLKSIEDLRNTANCRICFKPFIKNSKNGSICPVCLDKQVNEITKEGQ